MEAVGTLAGGIAHDFNNMLSALLGNLNLVQLKLPADSPLGKHLDTMEEIITRAGGLCRQMLAYSGRGRFVVEPIALGALAKGISELLAASMAKDIQLIFDLLPEAPAIEADVTQIQQVLMNLVTNAADAIGVGGGVITIRTRLRRIEAKGLEPSLAKQGLEPGDYVALLVEDPGSGMAADTLTRIFDPFFSTKGTGRGLGLSAMLGILRGHKAGIEIRSEPGQGSAFEILFRASAAPSPRPRLGLEVSSGGPGRFQGPVLVVDDEPEVRAGFAEMLEILGFQVQQAQDGSEALDLFRPAAFALVFMDLTMPRMDGRAAFLQMIARDPAVKVIMVSGYSELEAFGTLGGLRPSGFIQKPFNFQSLRRAVEKVLYVPSGEATAF